MQKIVATLCALIFMVVISGCGGNGTAATATTTLPAKIILTIADISGKTFYSTSSSATVPVVPYTFNAGNTVTVGGVSTDKWLISADGAIDWTDTTGITHLHKFICIQKEASYWLFYDAANNNTITRFYFDPKVAQTYLSSIFVSPTGVKLGGGVQGIALSVFSNVTTIAGHVGTSPLPPLLTSVDGTSAAASFNQPVGITTDGTNLYVADYKYHMIRKIVIASNAVTRLAGSPAGLPGSVNSTDGTGNSATFNLPTALTTDGTYLYVADSGNNSIRRVDTTTGAVSLIAGSTTGVAGAVDALNGTDARFSQPTGITTDGTNLYVADYGNQTIRKIVISSGAVTTLAGAAAGIGSFDSTDGTGTTARFNSPARITTDGTSLYVTEFGNRTIRKISIATGNVLTIAGKAGTAPGTDDAPAAVGTDARFNQPNGITTDGTNLYVTDTNNNTIRRISLTAPYKVDKIAGVTGSRGSVNSADGIPTFSIPIGITTDGTSLFVADSNNNTIRKIN